MAVFWNRIELYWDYPVCKSTALSLRRKLVQSCKDINGAYEQESEYQTSIKFHLETLEQFKKMNNLMKTQID